MSLPRIGSGEAWTELLCVRPGTTSGDRTGEHWMLEATDMDDVLFVLKAEGVMAMSWELRERLVWRLPGRARLVRTVGWGRAAGGWEMPRALVVAMSAGVVGEMDEADEADEVVIVSSSVSAGSGYSPEGG